MKITSIINKLTSKINQIPYLIFVISFALTSNISTASFITLSSIQTIDISIIDSAIAPTIDRTIDNAADKNTTHAPHQQTLPTNTEQAEPTNGTTFNQELQWRILNLLTQQLFDNNQKSISDMLFSNSWIYATNTFSVSISSTDPDFYQVSIIDSRQGDKTQLEIPRL